MVNIDIGESKVLEGEVVPYISLETIEEHLDSHLAF